MPNWKRFQSIVQDMITNTMGADTCTISIPPTSSYDLLDGEVNTSDPTSDTVELALIPTNKDDFDYIPEGFKEKEIRKIFSVAPLDRTMKITSNFDNTRFEIITPSATYRAGGYTHCYRTYVARVENS